jgi:hypothetical protein
MARKFTVVLAPLVALAASCSDAARPPVYTPLQPGPPTSAYAWGYVVGPDDQCLIGAVVKVVDSSIPGLIGRESRQDMCSADDGVGYGFGNVGWGTRLVLEASMPTYRPQTRDVVPVGTPVTFKLVPE